MKTNPLKYFNDQADKRRASFPKAALGGDGDPLTPNKSEYWQAGDSSAIKNDLVNRLTVRQKLENDAGYFTNTGVQLQKAKEDRDSYSNNREAYRKKNNLTAKDMSEFSKPIPVPEVKPYKRKNKSHFR